jgi:YgiT-type zinc finger domain-containing protein
MRKALKQIDGERKTFTGMFVRFGRKHRFKPIKVGDEWIDYDTTVLLRDIRDATGKIVTDHLWFNYTLGFARLGELSEGEEIRFNARVKPYLKGYVNHREWVDERRIDYKLSHPTKFARVGETVIAGAGDTPDTMIPKTCTLCKGTLTQGTTEIRVQVRDRTVCITGIPAYLCDECEEVYFSAPVSRRLDAIVARLRETPGDEKEIPFEPV